jgi:hypothetical protein
MFWQGIGKRDYLPDQYAYVFWGFSLGGYGASSIDKGPALDYWRPANETNALGPNTDAYFPKPYWDEDQANKNRLNQSRYVLDASYLRLKNVQIGYTIPKRLTKKIFVETAKFYVSGENLLTLTNLPKVFDPETCFVSDTRMGGLQQASIIYPLSKMFSCGINLTF